MRPITNVARGVRRKLDRVVLRLPCGVANILPRRLGNPVDDVGLKEVVSRSQLGRSGEENSGKLHSESSVAEGESLLGIGTKREKERSGDSGQWCCFIFYEARNKRVDIPKVLPRGLVSSR